MSEDILNLKIQQKLHDDTIFFKKPLVEFQTGITVLVGCNGYGKSSMIHSIKASCVENNIPYIRFDSIEHRTSDFQRAELDGDIKFMATSMMSSEGEGINMSLHKFAARLGSFIKKSQGKRVVVLIDALDSGYSIDNIVDFKAFLNNTVMSDYSKMFVIISANTYELTRGEKCFDPINGEYVSFDNYEQYREYILRTRTEKDKR